MITQPYGKGLISEMTLAIIESNGGIWFLYYKLHKILELRTI